MPMAFQDGIYTRWFLTTHPSYRRPKKPRSTRKLIGRIDDATGEIIPTRKKRNINTTASEDANNITTNKDDAAVSLDIVKEKDAIITEQRRQISSLLKEKEELAKELEHLAARLHQ